MLPGFRFLFAAIMLSMSLLIFGLGAAALFRAAHESFASNSSWRATPDVAFAQRPDATLPVLATLRIDPLTEKPAVTPQVVVAPAEPTEAITEPATNDQVAALPNLDIPPAEIAAETPTPAPIAENPPAPEATPVSTAAATAGETKTASTTDATKTAAVTVFDASSIKSEPVVAAATNSPAASSIAPAEPTTSAASATAAATPAALTALAAQEPEADRAAAKIAILGGPPVDIIDSGSVPETGTVKIPRARPDENAIKKRQQARRAAYRRRLAARARILALQQLQANPFTQPPFAQQPFAQQPFAQAQQNFANATARQAAPRQ
jgi:hypothetical protein